jgi:hypothetical protein
MNKTTPSQSDYCRLKVAHHLRENLVLSLVAVSVVLVFRYLTSGLRAVCMLLAKFIELFKDLRVICRPVGS